MRGLSLVLYGSEGVGKTSLGLQFAHLGDLLCLSVKESGFEHLEIIGEVPKNAKNVEIESWEDLCEQTSKAPKVLVIDSLSGLQQMLFEFVCRTCHKNSWENFTSYYKGQRVDSPPILARYLDILDHLNKKGTHVILIGHMVTTSEPNTLGADYLCHTIDMDQGDKGGLRSLVTKWAQAVLYMDIEVAITRVTERAQDKTVMEGKAADRDRRLIYTTKAPGHAAKNRLSLPPIVPMGTSPQEGFTNLWQAMPKVYQDLL
jgi:hypothetical protein